jgi:hypothetical protein
VLNIELNYDDGLKLLLCVLFILVGVVGIGLSTVFYSLI